MQLAAQHSHTIHGEVEKNVGISAFHATLLIER
jgi:hypothetical protein